MSITEPVSGAVPLSAPYYGASLGIAFSRFWRKYATFSGRASRSEYWWVVLIINILGAIYYAISFGIGTLSGGVYGPPTAAGAPTLGLGFGIYLTLGVIWTLAVLVPGFAVIWRRLHDTNNSGALFFLTLIPIVGLLVIVLLLFPPNPDGARFDK
jgi:uncharacterized membrane protein YhaH (DUF805 family)